MKGLVKFAAIIGLILGISGSSLALDNTAPTFENAVIDKSSKKTVRRKQRSRRRAANINPYANPNRVIRVRKLSRRQVRDFYRRMMDIHLN